jgi:hypothetical protein
MAAYHKVEVSLNTNAVEVGIPSPQTVNVVVPTIGPAGPTGSVGPVGPTGPQGVPGTGLEVLTVQGDILYQGASTGQRLAIGTSGQVLKVTNGIPSWANESGAVTSVNGATGAVQIAVPSASSTTPAALGTAAVGSASTFARADHIHAMPSAADVGALQSAVSIEEYIFDEFTETLPARRNAQWQITFIVSGQTRTLNFPSSGVQVGDRLRVALTVPSGTTLNVRKPNPGSGSSVTIATVSAGTRFVYGAQVTQIVGGTPSWTSYGELAAAVGASPLTSTSEGTVGQFSFSDNFMYVCIADNTWRRVPIAAF